MNPKLFTEYHHTPLGFNRSGKSKGIERMESIIKHINPSELSLRKKYPVAKYLTRFVGNEESFTEKKFKKGLDALERQKIINEKEAKNIFDISKGITPKHEHEEELNESEVKEVRAKEIKEVKPQSEIRTPRFDALMLERKNKAIARLETYKNRNVPGGLSGKVNEEDKIAISEQDNKLAENANWLGQGVGNKPGSNNTSGAVPRNKIMGDPKFAGLAHDNFSMPRLNK